MYAVHGFWSGSRGLCLWAEDPGRAVKSPSQATRSARPHPFAASAEDLAALHPGEPGAAVLLLPSLLTAPLDSPELVRTRPRPEPTRQPMLTAWEVPVVCSDPAAALEVLDQSADAVRYGASVHFLREVAQFARDLVERGRVVPTVQEAESGDETGAVARWRPVLQGPDIVTVQRLILALPPIVRAETSGLSDTTGQHPSELATTALSGLVDAAVRARLSLTGTALDEVLPRRRGRPPQKRPVAESWLQALSTESARFDADLEEIESLRRALAPWAEASAGTSGPARLTFRLTEVSETPPSRWQVEFLLQSAEDPSLIVPAEQVWAGGHGLRRWLDRPEELLLAELGRARALYPELDTTLRQARPTAVEMDPEAVHHFLTERADVLDQAGFGVLLPSWWKTRRTLGLAASATPSQEGGVTEGMFTREALCEFSWQLALGDDPLTEDELAALAATKAPLIQLRGEWVVIDPDQIRRGLEFLARQEAESGQVSAAEVIALATAHPDDLDTPLPVTNVHAEGWLGELLGGTADQALRPINPPEDFGADLRPYQQRGLSWLAFLSDLGLGACLADDMGLGKTVQLLALESLTRAGRPDAGPTLLLCPMSLIGNWQREAAKFAPSLRVYAHHGPNRLRGEDLDAHLPEVDIMVTTYHTATRDIDDLAERVWGRVVLDEAQAVKNDLSRSAKAVRRLQAGHRVALTGTPMENKLAELWSVMDFLNPGVLGTTESFRARYARPIERHGQTEPAERLRRITRPYVLRRLKTDPSIIDDLPDKIEIKQYCHLTAEQASLYQAVVAEVMPKIEQSEGIARRGNVLAAMAKLKQVCNHPAQLLHDGSPIGHRSGKVIRLEEILEEILAEGDRALLFTQYTEFADMLLPHLSARFGQDVLYLHGKTPQQRREEMVERFQSEQGPPIFLLSLKAGGTGLNLTAANHVIHLDRWWNPAVENQATDRAFRIGQRRNVQVRKFICTGTLEERIDAMIEQKKALADLVVGDGEGWLTELSTHELRSLFALSQEAVGE